VRTPWILGSPDLGTEIGPDHPKYGDERYGQPWPEYERCGHEHTNEQDAADCAAARGDGWEVEHSYHLGSIRL